MPAMPERDVHSIISVTTRLIAALLASLTLLALVNCSESPQGSNSTASTVVTAIEPPRPDGYPRIDPLVAARIKPLLAGVEAQPDAATAWLELGMVYQANWYAELAAVCYEHVTRLDPTSDRGWFLLGQVHAERSRIDDAITALEQSVASNGRYAPTHWRLGLVLFDDGRLDDAQAAFDEAIRVNAFDTAAWFGLARLHIERGELDEARAIINERLLFGTHRQYANQLLGRIAQKSGKADDARLLMGLGRNAPLPWEDPWTSEMQGYRTGLHPMLMAADTLRSHGRLPEAMDRYRTLLQHWPEDLAVRNGRALTLARQGHTSDALAALDDVLDDHPGHRDSLVNRGVVLMAAAGDDPALLEQAAAALNDALHAHPVCSLAHQMLGQVRFRQRDWDGAIASYRKALDCDAREIRMLVEIGRCHVALRRWGLAEEAFAEAVEREPARGDAWLGLGIALQEQMRHTDAVEALQMASRIIRPDEPSFPVLQQRLAASRRRTGG